MLVIFLANNWVTYGLLIAYTLIALILSKIPLGFFWKGIKTVNLGEFYYSSTQIFVYKRWRGLLPMGIHSSNIRGLLMRYSSSLLRINYPFSTLLTLTTAPLQLTDAIEAVMKPLAVVKFPVYEVALLPSIALRFVPTRTKHKNANAQRVDFFGEGIRTNEGDIPILIPAGLSALVKTVWKTWQQPWKHVDARGDGRSGTVF